MENKIKIEINPKSDQLQKEIVINVETEKELNSKILKITMKIKDQYPELSKYIEEMQETIPDEKKPEITLKNLKKYYDSLNSMLNKYISEHSNT
jgi:hypothetical protein